ncbi:hypothetical protein PSYMO_38468, partial [Pseudomonas amygdali pv. mori str. 301020]
INVASPLATKTPMPAIDASHALLWGSRGTGKSSL